MHLTLMVNNTGDLDGGVKATVTFDDGGGVIGSAMAADWILSDRHGTVDPQHLRAVYIDGGFCLEVLSQHGLRVNNSSSAVGVGDLFRVTDGDILEIGRFQVTAYVTMTTGDHDALQSRTAHVTRRFISVASLIGDEAEEALLNGNLFDSRLMRRDGNIQLTERLARANQTDPIDVLDEDSRNRAIKTKDPVAAFDREQRTEGDIMAVKVDHIINSKPGVENAAEIYDDLQPGSAYIALPGVHAEAGGEGGKTSAREMDLYLEALTASTREPRGVRPGALSDASVRDQWLGDVEADGNDQALIDHVVLRPLCQALGLPIREMSVPQANQLARDVGQAFRAAIAGLMATHRRELSDKSHLAETHLHAIEDNPLRLEQSVDDAIRDLLLVRSPVHLSASAAITESLELLQHHQQASEAASEAALDRVLMALGPVALAKRFLKYKGHAPRSGDLDAWHWQMYQHYYAEMRSGQQGGLSRMFWEVYRQVYDREMRQRTVEG